MTEVSRRDFLKLAGFATAIGILVACGVNPTESPTAIPTIASTDHPMSTITADPSGLEVIEEKTEQAAENSNLLSKADFKKIEDMVDPKLKEVGQSIKDTFPIDTEILMKEDGLVYIENAKQNLVASGQTLIGDNGSTYTPLISLGLANSINTYTEENPVNTFVIPDLRSAEKSQELMQIMDELMALSIDQSPPNNLIVLFGTQAEKESIKGSAREDQFNQYKYFDPKTQQGIDIDGNGQANFFPWLRDGNGTSTSHVLTVSPDNYLLVYLTDWFLKKDPNSIQQSSLQILSAHVARITLYELIRTDLYEKYRQGSLTGEQFNAAYLLGTPHDYEEFFRSYNYLPMLNDFQANPNQKGDLSQQQIDDALNYYVTQTIKVSASSP